jgi:long-chain fatty acid transport protein
MRKIVFTATFVIAVVYNSFSGGYQVGLHGQKQIGMGLIGITQNLDASSAFYNPAGLSLMQPRISLLAGASGIISYTRFQMQQPSVYQALTENPLNTPFYFYSAVRLSQSFAAGLAVNVPFGNSLAWPQDWAGRFLITKISMRAITIQPTFSFSINENLAIGAGLVYAMGSVDMNRALPFHGPQGEADLNISGSTDALGFNAGIMLATDLLNAGISYRSRIDMKVDDATANFNVPSALGQLFPQHNTVAVSLPLPANLDLGAAVNFGQNLMLGMALNYVFWSAYDSLAFNFGINTPALSDRSEPRKYSDRLIIRVGSQLRLSDSFYFRVGAYYDPSPVNENYFTPETPGLDNIGLTTGISVLPTSLISIDLSFLYIMGVEGNRSYNPGNFAGTYKSRAYIPGIGISVNL